MLPLPHVKGKVEMMPPESPNDASGAAAPGGKPEVDRLTHREQEVLILIADGLSTKAIAARLKITFKTAACHRSRIMAKCGVHNAAGLVRVAIEKGLINLSKNAATASDRTKLQELWRERLESAADRYRVASLEFQNAVDVVSKGLSVYPDGSYAVKKARIAESVTRDEHMRVLRIFTDLILYGKVPE
jgi:DNA-binding CsgD family transcriptional regulator